MAEDSRKLAKRVLTNSLLLVPGTSNWVGHDRVAERLLADLEAAGAVITFPDAAGMPKALTKSDVAFRRLVEMDRRDG